MNAKKAPHSRQQFFRDMVLGALLYSVVLGFFNDYTEILYTGTYSTTFAVAIVLQVLTYLTFMLKDVVVAQFSLSDTKSKTGLIFSVWVIMFFSKFVFLWVIDIIFGEQVEISGFIGLLAIIIVLTVAQKLVGRVDKRFEELDKKASNRSK